MERLTGKDELGYYAPRNITLNCLKHRGDLVDRLAAYEDTGLEPCDYNAMKAALEKCEQVKRDWNELLSYIGVLSLPRFRELAQADQEGRLVVLPYKAGQVVWVIRSQTSNGKNLYLREERIARYVISECDVAMCFESGRVSVSKWHWKTSVFLTREDAEATIERR